LEAIVDHVPPPEADLEADFVMLITQTEATQYFGRHLIGRVRQGSVSVGDRLQTVD